MWIVDAKTGETVVRKVRKRYDEPGHARELTFSCFRRYPFLTRDRTRNWFVQELQAARSGYPIDLWAYVIMPEHVHLLVYPREALDVGLVQGRIKEKVARAAVKFLQANVPEWLPQITIVEGKRVRRRFWQAGGGYDRNAVELSTVHEMIDYIHANPVRRGLVERAIDWEWSSARWYAGIRPVPIEMDATIPMLYG